MKKIFGLLIIAIAGYVAWIFIDQERQNRAVWTQVTDTWEEATPLA